MIIFTQHFHNNPVLIKNLDFRHKNVFFDRPNTPHNTTQYLSTNCSQIRNDNIQLNEFNMSVSMEEKDNHDLSKLGNIEEFFVTGGSMKGNY
jgi:hypothetical protein